MKRPLFALALSLIAFSFAAASPFRVIFAALCLFVLIAAFALKRIKLSVFIACLALGLLCYIRTDYEFNHIHLAQLHPVGAVEAELKLCSYPEKESDSDEYKCFFKVLSVNTVKLSRPVKVAATISGQINKEEFVPGNTFSSKQIYFSFNGKDNPGGFDYRFYLIGKGCDSAAYIKADNTILKCTGHLLFYYDRLLVFRENVLGIIRKNLSKADSGIICGIMLGQIDDQSPELNAFRECGAAHILAVSGMHVGILYSFFCAILRFFRLKEKLCILFPFIPLSIYVALAGFSLSSLRAFIMLIIYSTANHFKQKHDGFNAACFSLCLFMLIRPGCVFSSGMQLSFCASCGIVLFAPVGRSFLLKIHFKPIRSVISVLWVCFVASISVMPLSFYYFGKVSLFSVFANALIVPLISPLFCVSLIALLLNFCFLGNAAFSIVGMLCFMLKQISSFFASLGVVSLSFSLDFALVICSFLILIFAFGYVKLSRRIYYAVYFSFVVLLLAVGCYRFIPRSRVSFLSVGFGDCAVITTKNAECYMIDCADCLGAKTAEYVILPYMKYIGENRIDKLFISHFDSDHMGAVYDLMEIVNISEIYANNDKSEAYFKLKRACEEYGISLISAVCGDEFNSEELSLRVLWPMSEAEAQKGKNRYSQVILARLSDCEILFAGDIDSAAAYEIINRGECLPNIDIIKVAHHGASSAGFEALLDEISPRICVISVGKNNYGLPNSDMLWRIEALNIASYRTDKQGCVSFYVKNAVIAAD